MIRPGQVVPLRSRIARRATVATTLLVAAVVAAACAEKAFTPHFTGSPQMLLQLQTTGAQVSARPKMLLVAAAYLSSVTTEKTDSFRILGLTTAPVVAGSQDVSMRVDLTQCLADGTRRGSRDACSFKVLVVLSDSFDVNADTSGLFDGAYDVAFLGPFDAAPGKAPAIPAIDLSNTHFAVHQWVGDGALQLGGGAAIPAFFNSPITGVPTGSTSATATLFGATNGFIPSSQGNQFGGSSGGQLAIFANGTWSRVNGPANTNFNGVAALSASDVYISASTGLYHFDGSAITPVTAVTENLSSVASVTSGGAKYVVAGTPSGGVWFGNTTTWQKGSTGAGQNLDGVCINGPTEAFASSSGGGLYRFDGTNWTSVPASATGSKADLQCTGPGQAYVRVPSQNLILKWNGSGWTQLSSSGLNGRNVNIAVVSATEIYGAADSASTNRAFFKFDGTAWREIARLQFTQPLSARPWADPRGGAAYFASQGYGRIEMATPTSARPVSYLPSPRDIMMTSTTSAFAVGANMFLARWDAGKWSVDAPPAGSPTTKVLQGVWGDSRSNAWAVGQQSTIIHWNGSSWVRISEVAFPVFPPVEGYNAVWGFGNTVWIAGDQSIVRCSTIGGGCTKDVVAGSGPLYGIWGTSATNAFAVGGGGRILHFDGTSWTAMSSPTTHKLGRVWGFSATNVYAVGDTALLQYNGTSWQSLPLTSGLDQLVPPTPPSGTGTIQFPFQLGLWGNGTSELYIGTQNGQVLRNNMVDWDNMPGNFGGRVVGLSGVAGSCALAVTDGTGNGFGAGTNLVRGVGPAGCQSTPMVGPTSWP